MNGWTRSASTLLWPQPAKDHWLFASAPITQCPGMVSTTRDGPALHLPLPNSEAVDVGNVIVGPTPQVSLPEFAGERNTVGLMSPSPNSLSIPGAGEGWLMMGIIVRVIRFQSLFKLIGITGSTFRFHCVASLGPMPKLKLFWKGTLMRLATGFWVSLASFSVSDSLSLPGSAAIAVKGTMLDKIATRKLATGVTEAWKIVFIVLVFQSRMLFHFVAPASLYLAGAP